MGTRHDTMSRRRWGILGPVVVVGALALGACSDGGDGGGDAKARPESHDRSASVEAAGEASESAALCAIFNELAASGAGPGAQFQATTPEGWEKRIATNEAMVAAAPPAWRDEAETYLQMVKDRAQLAAEHGYVGVDDLPTDVRNAFISSHREMQAEVNDLIAYMGQECGARAAG